ncbi:MAG: peptidoglycan-associated lipoprotein Pal [Betaproteobacteria bacterium]|nr:peptidoglycan-associated lipoprotein Pal [Betaproteobacteria bacterium]
MRKLLAALITAALLAACATDPTKEQEGAAVEDRTAQQLPTVPPVKPADPGAAVKPLGTTQVGGDPLTDPRNILSKRSVYFDFDSYAVKDEYKPVVAAHAKYLTQDRQAQMRIEGNTDERGSREYNLALGQRRADAVKQLLQLLGASPTQIETVSFGEEKPKASGSNEAAWTENRRADMKYKNRGE